MTTVNVRLYARLKDVIGARDVTLCLPDGATIAELRDSLGEHYPAVQGILPTVVYAVDEEYVPVSHSLRDGDHVAVIPPVSGG